MVDKTCPAGGALYYASPCTVHISIYRIGVGKVGNVHCRPIVVLYSLSEFMMVLFAVFKLRSYLDGKQVEQCYCCILMSLCSTYCLQLKTQYSMCYVLTAIITSQVGCGIRWLTQTVTALHWFTNTNTLSHSSYCGHQAVEFIVF